MRPNLTIAFLIFVTFTSLKPWTNPIYISGHLKRNHIDSSIPLESLHLIVKGDNKVLAKTRILKNGKFELTFTPKTEPSFEFYCTGNGLDTIMVASVPSFVSDTPDFIFYLPARTKKSSAGQVLCIKCKKGDKVYEINYTGVQPMSKSYINTTGAILQSRVLSEGLSGVANFFKVASYYCDRDKVEF